MTEEHGAFNEDCLPSVERAKSLSTAGLACGIAGVIIAFIPVLNFFLGSIFGILAIVFGVMAQKTRRLGTAGVVLGSIALTILLFWVIVFLALSVWLDIDPDTF